MHTSLRVYTVQSCSADVNLKHGLRHFNTMRL